MGQAKKFEDNYLKHQTLAELAFEVIHFCFHLQKLDKII